MDSLSQRLAEEIATESQIAYLLDDAARTEKYLSKPKPPRAPRMYDLITTSYSPEDIGYYKKELKLRATPKQITRWEFAIDVLSMIKPDISKDPVFDRQLMWLKANRFKWTKIARFLGGHRTTLRLRYQKVLERVSNKVRKEIRFDKLDRITYKI